MFNRIWILGVILLLATFLGWAYRHPTESVAIQKSSVKEELSIDSSIRTIHVFVALCDNKYQGIVPVPAAIGNGQDKENNLYWGCSMGVRTYFKKSSQ